VRIQVVATPCQHWSIRSGFDRCKSLWTSWAVAGASNRVWFAGDTGYCPAFKEIGDTLGPFNLGYAHTTLRRVPCRLTRVSCVCVSCVSCVCRVVAQAHPHWCLLPARLHAATAHRSSGTIVITVTS
jgi:hypothetical protein